MTALAMLSILTLLTIAGGMAMGKVIEQKMLDRKRRVYRFVLPSPLDHDHVTGWLWSLGGTLRTRGMGDFFTQPSIVLEVWATDQGIVHRLKIPFQFEQMVRPKLEQLVPGIRLVREKEHPVRVWVHAAEFGLKMSSRTLDIPNPATMSASILTNFSTITESETLMMQWVIAPAAPEHLPIHGAAKTNDMSFTSFFRGPEATKDEVNDRRAKLSEMNMHAVLRVGAVAATRVRAQHMVQGVLASLDSARGPSTRFKQRMFSTGDVQRRIDHATTPFDFPAKLSISELASVIGWHYGDLAIPGMPARVARYLPAPAAVPAKGRVLGQSNYPGRERTVAAPYPETMMHTWIVGASGMGKTNLMAGMAKQDMENDYGLVAIESKGDLFPRLLDYVPPRRINDVIVMDLTDTKFPVGFNLLQQGHPSVIAAELTGVFERFFGTGGRSLWMHELMKFAIPTLMLDPKSTIMDLPALVSPNADERAWSDDLIRKVTDPYTSAYWQRATNQGQTRQDLKADPLLSRFHPLTDPAIRNILGQSQSTFYMDDVVKNNKILLVNLAGVDKTSASIMGTLIMNCLWNSVQRNRSQKGIHLYLDEFQRFIDIPVDTESMFAEARSMGLGMVLAHQQLTQIKDEGLKQSLFTNAGTKLLFKISSDDARKLANEMGPGVTDDDLTNMAKREVFARVMTSEGVSSPFTFTTLDAAKGYGKENQVRYVSRQQFGRPVAQVQDEMLGRRGAQEPPEREPPPAKPGWGALG